VIPVPYTDPANDSARRPARGESSYTPGLDFKIQKEETVSRISIASAIALLIAFHTGSARLGAQASISDVSPSSGMQGQSDLDVVVTGVGTHFAQGVTTASFGDEIGITSVTVADPTHATVRIAISPWVGTGMRTGR
jgi:hypothetical protein